MSDGICPDCGAPMWTATDGIYKGLPVCSECGSPFELRRTCDQCKGTGSDPSFPGDCLVCGGTGLVPRAAL